MESLSIYDVVGYVVDGKIYCPECAGDRGNPIFRSDEFDVPPVCEGCGEEIGATLATEGEEEGTEEKVVQETPVLMKMRRLYDILQKIVK